MGSLTSGIGQLRGDQQAGSAAPGHIQVLDVWRAVACLLVFTYHTGLNLRTVPFAIVGLTGVQLFFVLSGYLIAKPYLAAMLEGRPLPSIRLFYIRRFLRIYPPYLVSLVAFVAFRYAIHVNPPTPRDVALRVLMIFNYFPSTNIFGISPVIWSLAVEMQFYLLLPLACWLCAVLIRRPGFLRAAAPVALFFIVGLASRAFELSTSPVDSIRFRAVTSYLDLFACGMAVAIVQKRLPGGVRGPRLFAVAAIGFVLFIAANDTLILYGDWLHGPGTLHRMLFPVVVCTGAAFMLVAALNLHPNTSTPWFRATAWIGTISYSLYLYHSAVQVMVGRFIPLSSFSYRTESILLSLLSIGPALLASWIMFRLVEYPSLRLAARFQDRSRRPAPTPQTTAISEAVTQAI